MFEHLTIGAALVLTIMALAGAALTSGATAASSGNCPAVPYPAARKPCDPAPQPHRTHPRPHKQAHVVARVKRTRDARPTRGPRPRCFNPYSHVRIRCN